jgi:hypothetical protein
MGIWFIHLFLFNTVVRVSLDDFYLLSPSGRYNLGHPTVLQHRVAPGKPGLPLIFFQPRKHRGCDFILDT